MLDLFTFQQPTIKFYLFMRASIKINVLKQHFPTIKGDRWIGDYLCLARREKKEHFMLFN